MAEWFATGRIVDLVLVLTALEGLALAAYRLWTGRGLAPGDLFANLAAGMALLLALRAALLDAGWGWIALALTGALVAHLIDLGRGWKAAAERAADGR